MEIADYLTYVAKLKGLPGAEIPKRVDEVCERTAIADVKSTIIGKLSKGYRQRVGLAQALIHNPPVLILDEPTSGLDPQQQRDARQLIASLSGDHTIILSTHILSEVEQSCSKVIIINNGEIVASDTVANLHMRKNASEATRIEVAGAPVNQVKQALERVAGVASVESRESREGLTAFEVRSLENHKLRPELARVIVQAGWNLNLLTTVGESLEEIFLELTKSESPVLTEKQQEDAPVVLQGEAQ
jgi:ABC-2 type transport system ATP-binding protein